MTSEIFVHPAVILGLGALLLPLFKGQARSVFLLAVPILAFGAVLSMSQGTYGIFHYMQWEVVFGRVDRLSLVFGYIMTLMCIIGTLYGLHVKDNGQHITAWLYVAGSLGVIFCGDFLSLFLFWEVMAFSSVFLVWYRKTDSALASGFRYLLVHGFGGVVLLAGIVIHYQNTGDLSFVHLNVAEPNLAIYLIMIGFILNAAVPPLHAWLPDAYGEATVMGSVFMCAFTTKTAVYALARGFAGMEILIPLGVIMALYGVVYAVLENDCRRLLAYHVISQVGYMVAGVGIGTQLAINGTVAHAFAHILYKGLLFMGCGAVLHMTGKSKFSDLGGLYKKMPWTFVFTLIGGLSISAFPLFSGFVSKSIIVAASFDEHIYWAAFLLTLASAGTFLHTGLKVPYFIWFGKNNCSKETWEKAKDPSWNMNAAMAIASVLCIFIGIYTPYLYNMLPYGIDFQPYTMYHFMEVMQILLFTALGFFLLIKKLAPEPTISIDLDWFYRIGSRKFIGLANKPVASTDSVWSEVYRKIGLAGLMGLAKGSSQFDRDDIDRVVDGTAYGVLRIGKNINRTQTGYIQEYLGIAVFLALIVAAFVFFL
ncbi:Na(+)/H(+) antiporter subunit D [Desulfonatronovibrio hydrogenovorans]|uniref:Na(+)/H(+) antiporter subunit D n=1 Tax=Desulfonatronovibrio hydrogenovorans TaxID=53245 RepID=UPI00048B0D18|nr:Na(+)/H(+) antiporter subunit D [Desulfonatronovibrio hydrogenovorans]